MKTKNEKKLKFFFILKRRSNVPFDPRIHTNYFIFLFFEIDFKSKQIQQDKFFFRFSFFNPIIKFEK